MRLLFSVLILGTESLPAWRMTQPAREVSNSLVNRRGSGVGVSSGVEVGWEITVAGIRVGRSIPVGKSGATCVGVAGWHAAMRMRHPTKSFFMTLFITQLSSIKRRTNK